MKTKTQAISDFLALQGCKVDLYSPSLEVQVNVIKGPERIQDSSKTPIWTNGKDVWSAFRIPHRGSGPEANPKYNDNVLTWDLASFAESIGLSGWDWFSRKSLWVGFDFDSIATHTQGLTDTELDELRERVKNVPWITLRRSKSGKGYHLYVFFKDPVSTVNHFEHAALARAVLSQLSALLDFRFEDKVDTAGGILWIWDRSAKEENKSFRLIKEGQLFDNVPANWKDYTQTKRKTTPGISQDNLKQFDELISATKRHPLDDGHKALLFWLANQPNLWWWDSDKNMLVTHTFTLGLAAKELNMKGIYGTLATGRDLPHDHNCFGFPLRDSAWIFYRYGPGTKEDPLWTVSASGWTYCILNKYPDFSTVARRHKGIKTKTGKFRFSTTTEANRVLRALGINIDIPNEFTDRECMLSPGKLDSEIVITVTRLETDKPLAEWYQARGPVWERLVTTVVETKSIEPPDEVVRHVTTFDGGGTWFVRSRDRWVEKAKTDVKSALVALGFAKGEIEGVLGTAVLEDWQEAVFPFEDEYPGNRQWNRKAPQLAYQPKPGGHPTWDLVFNHVGTNVGVQANEWCRQNGINSGADYLRLWYASILRHPFAQLPYLFLVSIEQNTGKSIFHEAFQLLLRDGFGYTKADLALTNDSGFNGELCGAILAVVEEVDLSKAPKAQERIKDFVTSKQLFIRRLNQNGFMSPNTTHWIQCANDPSFCPIFPGDTRTTVIYVDSLKEEIPKEVLLDRLKNEAAYFLHTLFNLELPAPCSRLRIPVLEGDTKGNIQDSNRNKVLEYIEAQCKYDAGNIVSFKDFAEQFYKWLNDINERMLWSQERILKSMPAVKFPRGRYGGGGYMHIGNIIVEGIPLRKTFDTRIIRLPDGKLGVPNGTSQL